MGNTGQREPAPASADALALGEVAIRLTAVRTRSDELLALIDDVIDGLAAGDRRELTRRDAVDVAVKAAEIADLAEAVQLRAGRAPLAPVHERNADVVRAARVTVAKGQLDAGALLATVRWLRPGDGHPALADAVLVPEVRRGWAVSVGELLRAFRGSEAGEVDAILRRSELPDDARFDELDQSSAERLADALRRVSRRSARDRSAPRRVPAHTRRRGD
jgi:hypothetical protein